MHQASSCSIIFIKNAKAFHGEKNSLFNKWYPDKLISTCKTMVLNPFLNIYLKINSRLIIDTNEKNKTPRRKLKSTSRTLGTGKAFLDMTPTINKEKKEMLKCASSKLKIGFKGPIPRH